MNKPIWQTMFIFGRCRIIFLFLSWWAAAGPLSAQPYVTVSDGGDTGSLYPASVNIVTGMAVYWVDGSDDGSATGAGVYGSTGGWSVTIPGGIVFSAAGTYPYFDDFGNQGTVNVSANQPPTISIISPTNNAVFTAPASFTFSANASDPDADGLSDVEFYVGSNLVDDVFASPFETDVTNLTAGAYTLSATATDNLGATASASITILVQNSAPISLQPIATKAGTFQFNATNLTIGKTNILQSSASLASPVNWVPVATNVAASTSITFTNPISSARLFFRLVQEP
ncbi:MAG TPA: Ig-like domain-containing protein [Verrucomicrobiae bacterium]|nr:Ig-like domain-containing protein [Verrucomicrobiae bacterium]